MEIKILQLLDGAKIATGLTVIIDVFRAFSTACYAYKGGASKIIPVGDINIAYSLKKNNPEYLLVGEREEEKPSGFDFGNSPFLISQADLSGKALIHTTSSGTQGIINAQGASEIITGSFVNAGAIVKYIQQQKPEEVSLVCMGYACLYPTDEDTFCAEYIKNELTGEKTDFEEMVKKLRTGSGARFFDPKKQKWSPSADFAFCLDLNLFDFILKVKEEKGFNILEKVTV